MHRLFLNEKMARRFNRRVRFFITKYFGPLTRVLLFSPQYHVAYFLDVIYVSDLSV